MFHPLLSLRPVQRESDWALEWLSGCGQYQPTQTSSPFEATKCYSKDQFYCSNLVEGLVKACSHTSKASAFHWPSQDHGAKIVHCDTENTMSYSERYIMQICWGLYVNVPQIWPKGLTFSRSMSWKMQAKKKWEWMFFFLPPPRLSEKIRLHIERFYQLTCLWDLYALILYETKQFLKYSIKRV